VSWFSSNRGRIACLALLALVCQLLLSFGHLHLGKVGFAPIGIAANTALVVGTGEDFPALPRAPSPNHSTTGDGFCAVCASINLAASLVLPTAPTMVPPFSSEVARTRSYPGVEPVAFDRLFFEARGPPCA
jgi:hypothetical protein